MKGDSRARDACGNSVSLPAAMKPSKESLKNEAAPKRPGRPSIYSPKIAAEICRRLSAGDPLAEICRDPAMPAKRTVFDWRYSRAEFAEDYATAREEGFDAIARECLEIADTIEEDPASRRVRVDTRMKLLSKWDPKRYGDRVELDHSGTRDIVVVIGGNAD